MDQDEEEKKRRDIKETVEQIIRYARDELGDQMCVFIPKSYEPYIDRGYIIEDYDDEFYRLWF